MHYVPLRVFHCSNPLLPLLFFSFLPSYFSFITSYPSVPLPLNPSTLLLIAEKRPLAVAERSAAVRHPPSAVVLPPSAVCLAFNPALSDSFDTAHKTLNHSHQKAVVATTVSFQRRKPKNCIPFQREDTLPVSIQNEGYDNA